MNRTLAFRARIVLAGIDSADTAVARRLRTTKTTVAKWRGQFVERRLDGLYDEPRVGAPRTISKVTARGEYSGKELVRVFGTRISQDR